MSIENVYTPVDLSHKLDTNIASWPGLPTFECCPIVKGTHVDAPSHFIPNGTNIDEIPVERLFGPALIVDVSHKKEREAITWEEDLKPLEGKINEETILLFYTGWSKHYTSNALQYYQHPYLEISAAEEIAKRRVKVIGMDFASPDDSGKGTEGGFPVHRIILGAGIPIVENLTNLGRLVEEDLTKPDTRTIVNLVPFNYAGCDGAQVRALGWKEIQARESR
ncbi:putative cyclase [Dendrothele bispora CBS 962.96]|uniref:Putative cyclase n=1 Tax=Dendrothele bispora (strain CBS 962.96) TaxID=1314807 RepID=A0A4S8M4E6_DENBC|nr:putative cyclase [Dendrothele bispora CBS 962.96]